MKLAYSEKMKISPEKKNALLIKLTFKCIITQQKEKKILISNRSMVIKKSKSTPVTKKGTLVKKKIKNELF